MDTLRTCVNFITVFQGYNEVYYNKDDRTVMKNRINPVEKSAKKEIRRAAARFANLPLLRTL